MSPAPALVPPTCSVAVRALAAFTAKRGDLDLRFTPGPTAEAGIAGHQAVRARRGAGYQSEVALSGQWGALLVRGRADGYDPVANQLEEIKTCLGRAAAIAPNQRQLHRAQAWLYGALLCAERGLAEVRIAIVYYDLLGKTETVVAETVAAATLQEFFASHCALYLAWAQQEQAHRAARDHALSALAFPHAAFRPGQRDLAAAVYRTVKAGGTLLAEAPTGIGKTLGTLFPALKAMPLAACDRLFYLTAKVAGRQLAIDAIGTLRTRRVVPLRVLELNARDQTCEHPDKACHGDSCPLARGFYDRLPAARAACVAASASADVAADAAADAAPNTAADAAADARDDAAGQTAILDRSTVRAIALAHQVCPYYLAQEMTRWSDVVIGDFNHYFDVYALLHGLTREQHWRVVVLADEAHNLVQRARAMYSASLDSQVLRALARGAPAALKKSLTRLARQWSALASGQTQAYQVHAELPARFVSTLHKTSADLADHFAADPAAVHDALRQFHFDALHFLRLAESFGPHSLFDVCLAPAGRTVSAALTIRNVIPAPFLEERFATSHASVLFSATLRPELYYRDLLGLGETAHRIDIAAPYAATQLAVHVVAGISTRYQERAASVAPIADLMARQYASLPGNYLAFFSSFEYLRQVLADFRARHPGIEVREQTRAMPAAERAAFLERFSLAGQGIGFAVLGGSFGEAIDLPGTRLVGAFIATLGLPQVNAVNEEMRARLEQLFGAGYAYAYLYPGVQKVVQAAGRVIRGADDRGVVFLIDDRYARAEVRRLLPSWWRPRPWTLDAANAAAPSLAGAPAGPLA